MNKIRTQLTAGTYRQQSAMEPKCCYVAALFLLDHTADAAEARQSCRTARQLPGIRSAVTLTEPGQTTGRTDRPTVTTCSTEHRAAAAAATVSAPRSSNSSDGDFH